MKNATAKARKKCPSTASSLPDRLAISPIALKRETAREIVGFGSGNAAGILTLQFIISIGNWTLYRCSNGQFVEDDIVTSATAQDRITGEYQQQRIRRVISIQEALASVILLLGQDFRDIAEDFVTELLRGWKESR